MEDNNENGKNHNDIWKANSKVPSELRSSEFIMDKNRRELIRRALSLDIVDIRTYIGYKGDLLVEFTTMDKDSVIALKQIAESLEMEVTIRQNLLTMYEVFCITPTENFYELKI